jgi:hypothetical protein
LHDRLTVGKHSERNVVFYRFAIAVKVNQRESTVVNNPLEASQLDVVDTDYKGSFQLSILWEEILPTDRRVVK